MGTAETPPPFFPLLPSQIQENAFWQRPQDEFEGPQFKRQRSSEDIHVLTDPTRNVWQHNGPGILSSAPPPQSNPPQSSKGSKIFFKTRLCMKFKSGSCPYGQNCSFAHGPEELRRPPPNWPMLAAGLEEDRNNSGTLTDRQRLNKLKICRKFYSGEECPYGERCTFAHVEPGSLRESSAISVGVTESPAPPPPVNPQETDASDSMLQRSSSSSLWKAKVSSQKWEPSGN